MIYTREMQNQILEITYTRLLSLKHYDQLTYDLQLGFAWPFLISDTSGNVQSFYLLHAPSPLAVPHPNGEAFIKDKYISTDHGCPGKACLLHTNVPMTLHMKEAWLILVPHHLFEPTLNSSCQIPGERSHVRKSKSRTINKAHMIWLSYPLCCQSA